MANSRNRESDFDRKLGNILLTAHSEVTSSEETSTPLQGLHPQIICCKARSANIPISQFGYTEDQARNTWILEPYPKKHII